MILKKIIIFVTIFYSLNAEIIYQHVDKKFKGIQYNRDINKFHENVNVFLRDEYHRSWKDVANKTGEYLIEKYSLKFNPKIRCVESDLEYLSDIPYRHLENLREALSKSPSTYDIKIIFDKNSGEHIVISSPRKDKVDIYINQTLRFHMPRSQTIDLYAKTHLKLICSDNHETDLQQVFVKEDGATGGFIDDNKQKLDFKSAPRAKWGREEREERKKLSKKTDNPMVKGFRAIGLMKKKDKGVDDRTNKDREYAENLANEERMKRERGRERKRERERREQKYSPEVNFYTKDIQEQIQADTMLARDIDEQEKRERGKERGKYSRKPESALYESLKLLNNKF